MLNFNRLCFAVFLSAFLYCSCTHAQSNIKHVWVAREDHGDKPGIEYRLWLNDQNHIVGEMWVFTTDENGKVKERGKYPTTIKSSDQTHITMTFTSGDGSVGEFTIRFPKGLRNHQEQAVLESRRSQTKEELKFERADK
ncbi:MAG: hypothetical protein K9N47_04145 [Prosthecobacter sp.]|uniref:hypothetical protein n=1 Tax=Prosthecobacter sp. TaxID=1965333 RepID=UPI0025D9D213|nr:hypothetical protein [Prosthecobacter sp.]MCF7785286.1 hypothetical protein [Prosthecobacter sp.]